MAKSVGVVLLSALVCASVAEPQSPIQKVVTLITEMKAQTEKEAKEDMIAYDKYKCWCTTTEDEKTADIKAAETKLEELTGFIEEAAATEGQLKTEIAALEDDIAADKDALASATSMRAEENKEFSAEEADMKETLSLLSEAISVLSKVQLMQKHAGKAELAKAQAAALVQVRAFAERVKASPKFHNVMQKDLYDMLGALQSVDNQGNRNAAFLGEDRQGSLPWIKSEEEIAKASNPNAGEGAASGSKSYNSRSGGILGMLKQQGDEFAKNLAAAQKEELDSLVDFQALKASKLAEIAAGSDQKEQKELDLANLMDQAAKAKEEVEATTSSLSADQKFLIEATKNCQIEDEEYAKRVKVRTEEIEALGQTLDILTGDEARSLFDKTISFLQVGSVSNSNSAERAAAQEKAATRAMQRIVEVARKHRNWALASLAVRVKLDAFTKVKEAMDKMLVELEEQQKTEYEKHDTCKKQLDETEDKIKTGTQTKADLDAKHKDITNTMATVGDEIDRLKTEVGEMQVALKEAGEQRKAANKVFQQTMSDQRATITILNMALDRLKEFYAPKAALVEVHAHKQAPPPKPSSTGYEKSGSSGGVLQLLAKIITDAEATESEIQMGEQKAQEEYAAFVASSTSSIEADRVAIEEAEKQSAGAASAKAETEEAQLANDAELTKLDEYLKAVHLDCDFLLKYFTVRQEARAEEMDAIKEAKAILSGADFA